MIKKEKQFLELISTLSSILDLDENIKLYHAWRTALIAYKMAVSIVPDEAVHIFYAGLLHDVGAIGLYDHIIHYFDRSESTNDDIILKHPEIGAKIVEEIPGLKKASHYILDHHETYDGKGYPNGKSGDELSLGGQILHIADQLDLLLRKKDMVKTDIYNYFRIRKGASFTSELWPVFLDMLHSNGGTFYHILKEPAGYMGLMAETLAEVSQTSLDLPDNFLDQVVKVFAQIIDAKHSYTLGHTERVVKYSQIIGETLNLSAEELYKLKLSAYLHDIGKLGVPLSILDKKEPLTDDEFYKVKKHILITMEVLDSTGFLRDLTEISGYHHARWDGRGYPDNIAGEEIPLGARIICIADSFDAMTSDRSYRAARSFEFAFGELKKNAGTQFDPNIVQAIDNPSVVEKFREVYLLQKK